MKRRNLIKGLFTGIAGLATIPLLSFKKKEEIELKSFSIWQTYKGNLKISQEPIFRQFLTNDSLAIYNKEAYNTVYEAIENDQHKSYLVHPMAVEFQYKNNDEYINNKHLAFKILSGHFNKFAQDKGIGYATLGGCISIPLGTEMNGIYREGVYCHTVVIDDSKIDKNAFCNEGAFPKVVVLSDGKTITRKSSDITENRDSLKIKK